MQPAPGIGLLRFARDDERREHRSLYAPLSLSESQEELQHGHLHLAVSVSLAYGHRSSRLSRAAPCATVRRGSSLDSSATKRIRCQGRDQQTLLAPAAIGQKETSASLECSTGSF